MSAAAGIETNKTTDCEDCPLPLPEPLRGHGLTSCLNTIAPLIDAARERVRLGARHLAACYVDFPFDPETIEELLAVNLAEPLLAMMTRVMVLELHVARLEGLLSGDTPQQRFASFLARLRQPEIAEKLFAEYPVMVDQITCRLERWAVFSLEFLRHLCDDWSSLRDLMPVNDPGLLVEVKTGAGDTHRNGRSVIIATFTSGARIVYKPRSLAVDYHFQQLLEWLNACGTQPQFRVLGVLNCGDHGWTEFIETAPCTTRNQVTWFYRRQGAYLAILYGLHASDFHCENLIAAGEHPVLIDLEALFHPSLETGSDAGVSGDSTLEYSALRVGLLPMRIWADEDQPGVDMSGLGSAAGQMSPRGILQWESADTDEMRVVRKRMPMPESENRPSLNGERVNAIDFVDAVAEGFLSTYRALLDRRIDLLNVLDRFSRDEVRVIARGTSSYGALLHESFHPDVLRDQRDRVAMFDRLRDISSGSTALMKLIEAEQRDLLGGDIPFFTTMPGSRHLWTSDKDRMEEFFDEPALARVKRHLLQLNHDDLERQSWIVRASMATLDSQTDKYTSRQTLRSPLAPSGVTSDQLIFAASEIGDRLAGLAFTAGTGAAWLGLMPAGETEWNVAPLGIDFYDGLPGVAVFLARLGEVTGDGRYSNLARSAVQSLRRQVEQAQRFRLVGGFNGWGGVIYSLAHLSSIWEASSLLDEAEALLPLLPELIRNDTRLDVIAGVAGCALALRSLYQCRPSAAITDLARACGERLLGTAQATQAGKGWICGSNAVCPLTGFAHGNAGIAYALVEISDMTGDQLFAEYAKTAFDYERSIFSPVHGNWPDLRSNAPEGFAAAWCHGAPGIGLSRLCALRYQHDSALQAEIDIALSTTAARGFGSNHTLCHGDLGNAEILLYAWQILNEPRWRAEANRALAAVIHESRHGGWICGNPRAIESPGMMTGLAGMGYALLRFADPGAVPSILALEPPVLS